MQSNGPHDHWSRRDFLHAAVVLSLGAPECSLKGAASSVGPARLNARPRAPTIAAVPGLSPLGLSSDGRDGVLLVPAGYKPGRPTPLVLALHGAGGRPSGPVSLLGSYAEAHGFVLLVPASRQATWDGILDAFGPDVAFIDRALSHAFDRISVDPARIIVEGSRTERRMP